MRRVERILLSDRGFLAGVGVIGRLLHCGVAGFVLGTSTPLDKTIFTVKPPLSLVS